MKATIAQDQLALIAQKYGLEVVTVLTGFDRLSEREKLHKDWLGAGKSGSMSYLERAHTGIREMFPEVEGAVVFAVKYSSKPRSPDKPGHGRVARYAWGRDYHKVIPRKVKALVAEVENLLGCSVNWRTMSDSNPLLEKAVAAEAGVGFYGKNSLIIRPGIGSYTFLAELLWDVRITGTSLQAVKTNCGSCRRCVANCPTNAIEPEYSVDATKCISYLTIERRGILTLAERSMLGDWIFGCDICQEVCPFNAASGKVNPEPALVELSATQGVGEFLSLESVLQIDTDEKYLARFAGTPLMRAKREGLVRNALCVAVNTSCDGLQKQLPALIESDISPLIRRHALWALLSFRNKAGTSAGERTELERYRNRSDLQEEFQLLDAANLA